MAGKQIITIDPLGDMRGMDHKRKGLDLRQFGKAKTQRATLIEFDEGFQMWRISWSEDVSFPVQTWTSETFMDCEVQWGAFNGISMVEPYDIIFFTDYEDAVAAEVAVIQAMQLKGDFVGLFP
jgi:hypothetical protein